MPMRRMPTSSSPVLERGVRLPAGFCRQVPRADPPRVGRRGGRQGDRRRVSPSGQRQGRARAAATRTDRQGRDGRVRPGQRPSHRAARSGPIGRRGRAATASQPVGARPSRSTALRIASILSSPFGPDATTPGDSVRSASAERSATSRSFRCCRKVRRWARSA